MLEGVLQGVALGVALALLMLIYRTSHPQGAVLGQLPGTEAYRDVRRHPNAVTFPGLLIWRAGGVLADADSVNFIDTSACDVLLNAIKELQGQDITFAFAPVRDEVREQMQLGGIEVVVGPANFHERVTDGVLAWERTG